MNKKYILALIILLLSTQMAFANYGVQTKTSHCVVSTLPDPACSPGAVLTTNIKTICTVGYTKTVRDVSTATKKKIFSEYDLLWSTHSNYEVDHIISLELGGSNDISNLYPESYLIQNNARVKDKLENYLHKQICNGKLSIDEAQREISTDWFSYYNLYFNNKATTIPVISNAPPATATTTATPTTQLKIQSSGKFYTSSASNTKYYAPESCSYWKTWAVSNVRSFNSLEELLKVYPSRTLSSRCQ